jgi:hypothetical protein
VRCIDSITTPRRAKSRNFFLSLSQELSATLNWALDVPASSPQKSSMVGDQFGENLKEIFKNSSQNAHVVQNSGLTIAIGTEDFSHNSDWSRKTQRTKYEFADD